MDSTSVMKDILASLKTGSVVPYLGAAALRGVTDKPSGHQIPADSDSLIYAMTGGKPMAPRLMYEFPRAAMHLENKKGRPFIERFLTAVYGGDNWTDSELHQWIAEQNLPYVVDINRDTQMQKLYAARPHTLVVGAARLAATPYRFDLFECKDGVYSKVTLEEVNAELPVLFKPLGSPLPTPSYVASDADFVDYITELMGGFAIPSFLKTHRKNKQYLFLGMHFNRDTERMVMSDIIHDACSESAGWALIPEPTAKERKFLERKNVQLIEADWSDLIALARPATEVA